MSNAAPLLSVLMLARGNEPRLAESLNAAAEWAGEIVLGLLDGGPLPKGAPAGIRTVPLSWHEDFSLARNELAEQARGSFLLWLEPGETLSDEHAAELKTWIAENDGLAIAASLLIRRPAEPGAPCGEQVRRIRLLPAEPKLKFHGRVREQLERSPRENSVRVEPLPLVVRRGPEEIDAVRIRVRGQRNVRLAGIELKESGRHARLFNCLGEAFLALGDHTAGGDFFRQALAIAPAGSADRLEAYYGALTTLPEDPRCERQAALCLEALEQFPCDLQLLCAMGAFLAAQGRKNLATRTYQTAVRCGRVEENAWHLAELPLLARLGYSTALEHEGRGHEAISELLAAPPEERDAEPLRRRLVELHLRTGDTEAAVGHLEAAIGGKVDREALRSAVRGAALAEKGEFTPARVYLEAAYSAGCRDRLCLRWRALVRMKQNDAGALEALAEWKLVEPTSAEADRYLRIAAGIASPAPVAEAA